MAAEKGSAFLLKIGNGATPVVYATVAGLRTTQLSVNGEAVAITSKDSGGWRDLLSGAGVRSVSVSAAGVFTGSAAEVRVKANALAGTLDDDRQVPRHAAGLCRRFQRRAQLHAEPGKLRAGGERMTGAANPVRGEAVLRVAGEPLVLRPTFEALVAAEAELGPLFALVERAAAGRLGLAEMVGLFWHCLKDPPEALTRAAFSQGVADAGLVAATPALKLLIGQILAGR